MGMLLLIGGVFTFMTTSCISTGTCTVDAGKGASLWNELSSDTYFDLIDNGTNCEFIEKVRHYGYEYYKVTCGSKTGYIISRDLECPGMRPGWQPWY